MAKRWETGLKVPSCGKQEVCLDRLMEVYENTKEWEVQQDSYKSPIQVLSLKE